MVADNPSLVTGQRPRKDVRSRSSSSIDQRLEPPCMRPRAVGNLPGGCASYCSASHVVVLPQPLSAEAVFLKSYFMLRCPAHGYQGICGTEGQAVQ